MKGAPDSARAEILRSVREHLAASPPADAFTVAGSHASPPPSRRGALPMLADPLSPPPVTAPLGVRSRFVERATAVGAHCTIVGDEREALATVSRILASEGARRVARSSAPVLNAFVSAATGLSREALFACDAGVTAAQHGIAETGTLVLLSAREDNRLLSLVPPLHIAVLYESTLCATLEDALRAVRAGDAGRVVANHAITFITGPSRSADIELTLTIGVHGPRSLHIILVVDAQ